MIFESPVSLKNLPFIFGNHSLFVVTLHPDFKKSLLIGVIT